MNYDYFYGSQAESYSFIRVPRLLMTGEEFRALSTDAKLLYSLLLDRMGLSMRSGWLDGEGRVYIYYTIDEIQEDLNCGHGKACKLLAELDTVKGIGLIERKKQGQGKPTKIYVKQFAQRDRYPQPGLPESISLHERNTDGHTAENGRTGKPESSVQDSSKAEGSYINKNYTEKSYTDQSIYVRNPLSGSHSRQRQCSEIQEISSFQAQTQPQCSLGFAFESEDMDTCLEELKEQIDYPLLAISYGDEDPGSILELICDTLCSSSPGIKIGSETIPGEKVRSRFRKLKYEHVAYVLDCLEKSSAEIKNIRAYLMTALYNAPLTIGPYYSAAVRHDAAQQKCVS